MPVCDRGGRGASYDVARGSERREDVDTTPPRAGSNTDHARPTQHIAPAPSLTSFSKFCILQYDCVVSPILLRERQDN